MSTNYQIIARLKRKEVSNRKIADITGMARNTVNGIVVKMQVSGYSLAEIETMSDDEIKKVFKEPTVSRQRSDYVIPDYERLSKELARPGVSMALLWEEYVMKCRSIGRPAYQLTQFKKYFRDYLTRTEFTEVIHRKAGELIEVDWAGTKVHWQDPDTGEIEYGYLFVGVLPFSGYSYAQACPDMKMASWIESHNNMFKYFGGVSHVLVPDNLKTGVTKHTKEEVILNATYSDMAEYYGTIVIPARVRKPRDKATAENTVGKLTTHIIARLRNYQFFSIDEYNEQLRIELDRYNNKPFQKKSGSRRSVFLEYEKSHLIPLPEKEYELCEWRMAKVQSNSHISYKKNYYSVPYQYIGKEVKLKIGKQTIDIYLGSEKLCTHQIIRDRIGFYSTADDHMPANSSHYGEWNSTRYLNWAKTKGPNTYQVIFKLFENTKHEQRYYRAAHSILKLADQYSDARLEQACQYALTMFEKPTYKNLKHIIATNQDKQSEDQKSEEMIGRFVRGGDYFGRKN